jgi:hypothetical protein
VEEAMPPVVAAAGIAGLGSIAGGLIASSGASHAANVQNQADQAAINEQRRQFNVTDQELAPFRQAGQAGLTGFGNLLGTNGGTAQQAAITALQASPYYQSLYRNGLEANLQNASATGGLRGGNEQYGLANFGADTLAQVIQNQLGNLGGLAQLGLGATNSTGAFGAASSNNISSLLAQQGQNSGDAALAQSGALAGIFKNIGSIGSMLVNPAGVGAIPAASPGNIGGWNVGNAWNVPIGGF